MKLQEMKASELTDILAVIFISIALFMAIWLEQKDLTLLLGGGLCGVIGMGAKAHHEDR